jgi:hypothetical protein
MFGSIFKKRRGGKGRDSKHLLDHFLFPPKLGGFGGEGKQ